MNSTASAYPLTRNWFFGFLLALLELDPAGFLWVLSFTIAIVAVLVYYRKNLYSNILKRFFGRGVYPQQLASILTSPLRRLILSPKKLVRRLGPDEDSKVLELGPGPGYFSLEVAHSIPRGYLLLIDVQREMLEKAKRRLLRAKAKNVGYVQGDGCALPVRSSVFDVVFLVAVLGEVEKPFLCLKEIHRVLRQNGLLSVTEQPGDPDFVPLSKVQKLATETKFSFERVYGHEKNYTANFRKFDATKR